MLAELVVEGKTVHLKDIAIYPQGAKHLDVGTSEMMTTFRELGQEAKDLVLNSFELPGKRYSGANLGRLVDILIDLTRR